MEPKTIVIVFGALIAFLIIGIVLIFAITQKSKLIEIATLLMALGTITLAAIAFSEYIIEARPKLFFRELSPKSTHANIIYTLYNTGKGSAHNIKIKFDIKAVLLNENMKPIKTENHEADAPSISHLYPGQPRIASLKLGLTEKGQQVAKYCDLDVRYTLTYEGKLFGFKRSRYEENGSFGFNAKSGIWMVNPD